MTMTAQAVRQGKNRLVRGEQVFRLAEKSADAEGLEFNWKLVHAKDVGHSGGGRLRADEMIEALGFR